MARSLAIVAVAILAVVPLAAADPVTYHVHGTAALADNRAPAPVALTMDLTPGAASQPRIVIGHSAGDTINGNPVTASFVAAEPLLIGDSDPATPDTMTATVCISQTTQSAFVTRMLVTIVVDGVRVARRLSNDFGIPANAPSCKPIAVTIGMFVDSQTPANDAPLEITLDAAGNLAVPAGATLSYLVDVDTAIGGPVWGYYYDSPAYPTSLAFNLAPAGAAGPSAGPTYSNLTGTQLSQSISTPTNGTYVYNLTTSAAPATFVYRANGTGAAAVTVRDPAGVEVFNQTLTAPHEGILDLENATAGNWSYEVSYKSFNGTIFLDLEPARTNSSSNTSTSASASNTTSSSNGPSTGGFPLKREEKTPALGPAVLVALFGLLAVTVRRRIH